MDENFPPGCIQKLAHFDVKHAVLDYDFSGREDKFHFEFSKKEKRILVTLDRDYENDRDFPLQDTFGTIIISTPSPITPEKINKVLTKLRKLLRRIGFDNLKGAKIFATQKSWTKWYIKDGEKLKENYSYT